MAPSKDVIRGAIRAGEIDPAPYNPRTITPEALAALGASLDRFGLVEPIVVNRRSSSRGWPAGARATIVGGHQRHRALLAKHGGELEIEVTWVDLDEAEEKALNLALNNPASQGEWDAAGALDVLAAVQAAHSTAGIFDELAFDQLEVYVEGLLPSTARQTGDDDVPPLEKKAVSKRGEVYELGPHRLICGDATDAAVVAAVVGDDKVQMVCTDPPYGVNLEAKTKLRAFKSKAAAAAGNSRRIENDDATPAALAVVVDKAFDAILAKQVAGGAWFVFAPTGPLGIVLATSLLTRGIFRQGMVWEKDRFVMAAPGADYHHRIEQILYGWKPGAKHRPPPDRKQDDVWVFDRPQRSDEHPTMKPVPMLERCITNHTKEGDRVADIFGGSGSTLIACAGTNRIARLVELDPLYCDVIRRRWTRWAISAGIDPGKGALK